MDKFKLYTEHSPWFILLCILAGLVYAFVLYQKKAPWGGKTNKLLFALRFILITLLCFLLIGPLIKYIKNYIEKPTIVLAIDNSHSLTYGTDQDQLNKVKNELHQFASDLQKEDIKVNVQLLNTTSSAEDLKNIPFEHPSTNLSGLLNDIQSNFENRNLAGVVLVSDGIYNQGIAPNYNQYNFPLFTVAMGDTIPKKDINLKSVLFNKLSYQGNKFPIVAEIHNHGFTNQNVNVLLKQGGKVLQKKSFTAEKNGLSEIEFLHSSETKGLQHYVIEVEGVPGEFTLKNNIAHAYIDIIEGKENILIVALAPHPDIKAIKSALESKENYQVDTYVQGISTPKDGKYDLVIFHQIPDMTGAGKGLLDKYLKAETSVLFIAGSQSQLGILNNLNSVVRINARRGQYDNIFPSFNTNFDKFKIEEEERGIINSYPPLTVPFGDFELKENSDVILYQKIGSVVSSKPLLIVNNTNNKKTGVLLGEGIWEWRLTEFSINQNTDVFDKFIGNLAQYLSSKEDKRKFRTYPVQNDFFISDKIIFETETYNDVFEKIYGQKIDLKVTDEKGTSTTYSFVNSENNSRFEVKGLLPGLYKYTASTRLSGKPEVSSGEFTVKELLLEAINTTADHQLLRLLSDASNGKFYFPSQLAQLSENIKQNTAKSIIHTNEEFVEMINLTWLFFLILVLISAEWFIRRYTGGY